MNKLENDFIRKSLTFFDYIDSEDQDSLLENISEKTYLRGNNIYSAKNDCIGVLLIKSGSLRVYVLSEDGREVTLYRLSPGDVCVLSASCLIKTITFDVHIDAEIDSQLYFIDISIYSKLQSENIYVENFSHKTVVDKFSHVMWAMEQMLFMKFDRRLATFLYDESVKTHSPFISLTHQQIANYMGSAREVVSRMIKHFEKEGIVRISRGSIEIIDEEKLKTLL